MEDFYRVEKAAEQSAVCTCDACVLWTVVFNDPEIQEIGTSWQGEQGKELASDVCDLMNMAYERGREDGYGCAPRE